MGKNKDKLDQLTDKELLEVAKQNKPSPIIDAFFIGFLVGVIIFGVAVNTWGFLILIPVYLIEVMNTFLLWYKLSFFR